MSHKELIEICAAIKDLANLDAAPIREKLKKRAEMILDQMGGVKTDVSVFRLAEHAYETFFRGKLHQPALADAPQATRDGWVNAAAQIIAVYTGVKPDVLDPRPVPDPNKHLCGTPGSSDKESDAVENDVTDLPTMKAILAALDRIPEDDEFSKEEIEAALQALWLKERINMEDVQRILKAILKAPTKTNIFARMENIGWYPVKAALEDAIKNGW